MIRTVYIWLAIAGVLIVSQAAVRPPANLLSFRDNSTGILLRIWPQTGDPLRLRGDGAGWPGDRGECGSPIDVSSVVPRVMDASYAVEHMAQNIYRGDIVEAVVETTPAWRIRLGQLLYGLGLWSGRLDEGSSLASPDQVEKARRFAVHWYTDRVLQLTCDAARVTEAERGRTGPKAAATSAKP